MDCEICTEKLNKSSRKPLACIKCQYIACATCWKTYLTGSLDDPHCMSCDYTWGYEEVVNMFDKTFITKKYKKHREEMLISRERSLMPATQPFVEQYMQQKRNKVLIEKYEEEIIALMEQINVIRRITYELGYVKKPVEKGLFIRKCTHPECLGYLSSQWKCGLCENWSCSKCFDVIGAVKDGHECNPDTLATATLIKSDTKLCPKCSMGIFKIHGCDVMFCTDCHTSFNWRTNRIITGSAHNPHQVEWLATQAPSRNNNVALCGREIDHYFINNLINVMTKYPNFVKIFWRERCRLINHISDVELPRYETNIIANNQPLRVQLMCKEISEDKFKAMIHKREKACNKKQAIYNILTMFASCQTDIMHRLYEALKDDTGYEDIVTECDNLVAYANECFVNTARAYNSKVLKIMEDFKLV